MTCVSSGCVTPERLPKEVYLDKCRGGWAGQMIGVVTGAPYEFEYNGKIQEDPIRPWKPGQVGGALNQDDLYVEMTWLDALLEHGPDITMHQAGEAFAATTYGLAEANNTGRQNIRYGIAPPMSGHPKHNRHADDIDFQIEADVIGIICPGLPRESNRLCDVFGHLMNYGDGVYGGMFVAGMYSAAYFESEDIEKVIRAGLACIPAESLYHQCISDVIRWYHEQPDDWRATWHKIEEKWQDDIDCVPGDPFNIDAKLNGAYVVVALLYGQGNVARTLEIGVRCGQDSDCNPATAVGVLGCMKGFSGLPKRYTSGFDGIKDKPFGDSTRTFPQAIEDSQTLAEQIIRRAGGRVTEEAYEIPVQRPVAAPLEQWENQMEIISVAIPPSEMQRWDPRFTLLSCGYEFGPGHKPDFAGIENVMLLVPKRDGPAFMEAHLDVPDTDTPKLHIPISSFGSEGDWVGEFRLEVLIDGQKRLDKVICTYGKFEEETIDLSGNKGQAVDLRIEVHQEGKYHWERAYFGPIVIE